MTEGDNNASDVKMHSSQRNGHPTKRKKLTDQTAHSCPSQTDGAKKRTPTDSVWCCSHLDWCAPHSLSQTKGTDKNKHGRSNISEEREEVEGDEVKECLTEREGEEEPGRG